MAVSAQPYLDRISDQLHEAANMATLEGDDILYIARSATVQRLISVDLSVGGRLQAYSTSMGRILLAALDDTALRLRERESEADLARIQAAGVPMLHKPVRPARLRALMHRLLTAH